MPFRLRQFICSSHTFLYRVWKTSMFLFIFHLIVSDRTWHRNIVLVLYTFLDLSGFGNGFSVFSNHGKTAADVGMFTARACFMLPQSYTCQNSDRTQQIITEAKGSVYREPLTFVRYPIH